MLVEAVADVVAADIEPLVLDRVDGRLDPESVVVGVAHREREARILVPAVDASPEDAGTPHRMDLRRKRRGDRDVLTPLG